MSNCLEKAECLKDFDEKLKPLHDNKLDKWIFKLSLSVIGTLLFIVFTISISKSSESRVDKLEKSYEKYDGLELRIVREMNEMEKRISAKIENLK